MCGGACLFLQILTGNCGVIRAFENITTSVAFSGKALGVYTSEIVCLVLNQVRFILTRMFKSY